ncbi:hypothetical protein GCM10020000_02420 [Streptomyces olivoverticillatus]
MTLMVLAAFFDLGLRKAGTPLEMASTPVSAVQPLEKARRHSMTRAKPARPVSPGFAEMPKEELSAAGACPSR